MPHLLSLYGNPPPPFLHSATPCPSSTQASKLKTFYTQLTHALREYDRVVGMINPVTQALLQPNIQVLPGSTGHGQEPRETGGLWHQVYEFVLH